LRVVLGIGNIGAKYNLTRHNIGFMVLDFFSRKLNLCFKKESKNFYKAGGNLKTSPFYLIKPTTYVNKSGIASFEVLESLSSHANDAESYSSNSIITPADLINFNLDNFLVIADDLNLPIGKIRIRKKGGDGGHNGLKSIIYSLSTETFPRIRIGIGSNEINNGLANYVLGKFSENEIKIINESIKFTANLIENFIISGYENMIDYYSQNSENYYSTIEKLKLK